MISADTIRRCANLDSTALERILRKSYPEDRVTRSEFLGISNAQQFVYSIVFPRYDGIAATAKVFVHEDMNGDLVVDY
jgi:hypothetical protein